MTLKIALIALLILPAHAALAESDVASRISLEVSPAQKHPVSGSVANVYIGNNSTRTEPQIKIVCSASDNRKQIIETQNATARNVFPGQVAYSNVHFAAASDKISAISCKAVEATP